MKNYLSILTSILLFVAVSCQQQSQQSPEEYQNEVKQKIAEFEKNYYKVWLNENLDSVMTFLDEGYVNMFNLNTYANKEQCREMFKNVFDTYSTEDFESQTINIIVDQNYVIKTGLLKQKWITTDKKDTIYFDMRGMTIFKKQEDGSWKLFRDFGQE
jgi:ketosteroid isomerase-like protein